MKNREAMIKLVFFKHWIRGLHEACLTTFQLWKI